MDYTDEIFTVDYDEAPEDPTGFRIEDGDPDFPLPDQISWCLRKAGEHDRRVDELKDFATREARRILAPVQEMLDANAEWLSDAVSGENAGKTFFVTKLEDWAIMDRGEHLDTPSQVKLPSGSVSTTVRHPAITVDDAAAFVEWHQGSESGPAGDDILSWKPVVSIKAIKASDEYAIAEGKVVYLPTGEMVPGLGVSELSITPKVVLA